MLILNKRTQLYNGYDIIIMETLLHRLWKMYRNDNIVLIIYIDNNVRHCVKL